MPSREELTPLWEQAVADENWDAAAELQAQLATIEPAATELPSSVQEQDAILDAEAYWGIGGIATRGTHAPFSSNGPRDH